MKGTKKNAIDNIDLTQLKRESEAARDKDIERVSSQASLSTMRSEIELASAHSSSAMQEAQEIPMSSLSLGQGGLQVRN